MLTDFCNECGNCTTACPTSGEPYRDKPRLYLDRTDFLAQDDNAFMVFSDGSIEGRFGGETHRLALNGAVEYSSPAVSARLDAHSLELLEALPGEGAADGRGPTLQPAADMFVLLTGLQGSMPHLPLMAPEGETVAATTVAHPGYRE